MGLAVRPIVRLFIIAVSLAWLASCAAGPGRAPTPVAPSASKGRQAVPPAGTEPGSLFNAKGQRITHKAFAELAAKHDYILLGESHGSRCDHISQAALIRAMAAQGSGPVVGLEMVDVTRQDILDEFADDILDAQVVEERLDWQKAWGYGFDLYEPIFLAAKEHKLPMAALNLPQTIIAQVSAEGLNSLSPEETILLPESIVPPPAEQAKVLEDVFTQHSSGEDMDKLEAGLRHERFFLIQSLWDSKMAEQAVEARRNFARPVAIVAGAGHVEFGWGIAHRLRTYDPGAKILLVLPWRGKEPREGADVFYYCPATHRSSMGMVLQEEGQRVIVMDVDDDSRAGNAGLQVGDVITMAGATPVTSLWDLHKAGVEAHKAGKPLTLTVLRDSRLLTLDLGKLGKAGEP
ncbi:ChaN family lipoprotein [Desulfocurvibacter africanus]|uniref:ChaN family lipoprotein n=1 Tax=Desulfocurvibacter africanus TaxID=873 RepID=UPI0003FD7A40|nr:ChaN family lipoprotein [Desulfocurvibacter africanus]